MNKKHTGAHSELHAAMWLLKSGYEVFRNVSAHGAADIVAMKDGEVLLLDVKTAGKKTPNKIRVNKEQLRLGVKLLVVFRDGNCEIVHNPTGPIDRKVKCLICHEIFERDERDIKNWNRPICSEDCFDVFERKKFALREFTGVPS